VFDSDGDRFTAEVFITYKEPGEWMPFTVDLEYLVQPTWAEYGDGSLNFGAIKRLEIMEKFNDETDHVSWFDLIYLGGDR